MELEGTARLIEAVGRLIGALAWPAVVVFALALFGPPVRDFLSALSEVRLKGGGFEATAARHTILDPAAQKLHDFWKPAGKIDRSNAGKIAACMRQLDIGGTLSGRLNAATAENRMRVMSCLGLDS